MSRLPRPMGTGGYVSENSGKGGKRMTRLVHIPKEGSFAGKENTNGRRDWPLPSRGGDLGGSHRDRQDAIKDSRWKGDPGRGQELEKFYQRLTAPRDIKEFVTRYDEVKR